MVNLSFDYIDMLQPEKMKKKKKNIGMLRLGLFYHQHSMTASTFYEINSPFHPCISDILQML